MKEKILKFKMILVISLISVNLPAMAQVEVRGKVISEGEKEPLPGVNIIEMGTSNGTITDIEGNYAINVKEGATLKFTYIGYAAEEIPVEGRAVIDVSLLMDLQSLQEIVVIGYGTQKKSDVTGSVASISSEDVNRTPSSNVGELLRGKAPGLQVATGNARPGGESTIRIRGNRSLSGGNAPLFVVDGSPVESINDLSASDIASVEVLKDASAAAIYGARAANGVILITTKRGKTGETTVTYNGYLGVQQFVRNFDLFSGSEYADMRREAFRAGNATASNPAGFYSPDEMTFGPIALDVLENEQYVDWEELVLKQNPIIQQHDIRVSGGNERTKVSASVGYFSQDGIIPYSYYDRGSLRVNVDQKVNKRLNIGLNTYLTRSKERIEENLLTVLTMTPLAQPYDGDGELVLFPTDDDIYSNPLYNLRESDNEQVVNRGNLTFFADLEIIEGLKYRLNTNINFRNRRKADYLGTKHVKGRQFGGEAQLYSNETFDYLIENILTYDKKIAEIHSLNITALQSAWERKYEDFRMATREIGNDLLNYNGIANGAELRTPTRNADRRAITSYMGRITYSLLDRYLLTVTGRADGSSVFGASNKFGFFPSVAVAWKLQEESFMQGLTAIDALKLRLSYGQIGNQGISPYQTLATTTDYSYVFNSGEKSIVGYLPGPNDFPNQGLKWETTTTLNVGLDYSFLRGRLEGAVDYYMTNTTDLLVQRRIAGASGYTRVYDNLGETRNKGIEASLNAFVFDNTAVKWSVGANFAANKNEIVSIFDEIGEDGKPINDVGNNWFIGFPINVYYDYDFDGIWQMGDDIPNSPQPDALPGHVKVKDTDGDGVISADDRIVISRDPKWYGSLFTNVSYKGFDLYAEFNTVQGITRRNPNLYDFESGGQLDGRFNGLAREYWTPENPSNTTFRPTTVSGSKYKSAAAFQDASYIRLRTLTLGYNFQDNVTSKIGMRDARIYVRATNLFTKTDFLSYGPETNPNSYPEARVLSVGVNVSF